MKLTPALISNLVNIPIPDIKDLDVSKRGISHIEDISACVSLRKLNLAHNDIRSPDALSGIQYLDELTLLNLSGNHLESCEGVHKLTRLFVLNMSHNQVNRISIHVTYLKALKALILNHNKIKTVENIGNLVDLNTLVISNNKLDALPSLPSLTNLTKLSAAHNKLHLIPDLSSNAALKELRLNDNKILAVPETVRECSALEILDLGNNLIREWSDVAPLGSLIHLLNLNLKGNPICQKPEYKETILQLIPSLRVLDGERFDLKFLERREKQQAFAKLKKEKEEMLSRKKEVRQQKKRKREGGAEGFDQDDMKVDEQGEEMNEKGRMDGSGKVDRKHKKSTTESGKTGAVAKKRGAKVAVEQESEGNEGAKTKRKEAKNVGMMGRGPLAPHLLQAHLPHRDLDGDLEMEDVDSGAVTKKSETSPRRKGTATKEATPSKKQPTGMPDTSKSVKHDPFFETVQDVSKSISKSPNSANKTATTTSMSITSVIRPSSTPHDSEPITDALLRSGVVAVVDHTKKAARARGAQPKRAPIDVAAVLEMEAGRSGILGIGEDTGERGTGLDVGGWD